MVDVTTFSPTLFEGKSVLVTGAGTGIGAGIALAFAAHAARVAVHDITPQAARQTVDRIEGSGGRASAFGADLSQPGTAEDLFDRVLAKFGTLDFLVNNAGRSWNTDIAGVDPAGASALLELDVLAIFWLSRRFIFHVRDRGGQGAIVQIASTAGMEGYSNRAIYCGAKAGVIGLSRVLAMDHACDGVRVNCISPFVIETPNVTGGRGVANAREIESWKARIPAGRLGTPDDVAGVALFLCSPASAYLTGGNYVVDGGGMAGAYQPRPHGVA